MKESEIKGSIGKKEQEIKPEKYIVSSSPHLLKSDSTKSIMWSVSIFLMPATIFGIIAFGFHAALIVILSIIVSMGTEAVILALRKKRICLDDGSAFLTGLLLGLNMPPAVPLYVPILSSIFAIAIVKQAFGGLGQNWANPAIGGRVFALFAWSKQMTTWSMPFVADTVTTATPLGVVNSGVMDGTSSHLSGPLSALSHHFSNQGFDYLKLFFGFKGGSIGEISGFLLLIGAIYLIYKKIITLDIPIAYIVTVGLIAFIFDGLNYKDPGLFKGDFLFHILTGGLIIGAFFMATDMVTTPLTVKGRIIFGIGCGIITMLIRMKGALPEGVSLSILFMNMLTPAIDRFVKVKPMGFIKKRKVVEG